MRSDGSFFVSDACFAAITVIPELQLSGSPISILSLLIRGEPLKEEVYLHVMGEIGNQFSRR
jgi:hypothetical protein